MKPQLYDLTQRRGQWYATCDNTRTRDALGANRIAVVRDWDNGMMDWHANPPHYTEREQDGWWGHNAAATWRSLITDGAAVWVRKTAQDGTANASVGRSVGIWRIAHVTLDSDRIEFSLKERVGDTR